MYVEKLQTYLNETNINIIMIMTRHMIMTRIIMIHGKAFTKWSILNNDL